VQWVGKHLELLVRIDFLKEGLTRLEGGGFGGGGLKRSVEKRSWRSLS